MSNFLAEFIGTTLLLLLGNGVVANVILEQTKGFNSGWLVITVAWGLSVFVGVFVAGPYSGAHLNPAVSVGLAMAGVFEWSKVPEYIAAQMLGAALGTTLAWLTYRQHLKVTPDANVKLSTFSTMPAIRGKADNFFSEAIGTFVLVFAVLFIAVPTFSSSEIGTVEFGLGAIGALPVALLVFVIGLSLGGTTGYAINPARDLAPRIMHALLPIAGKRDSDWGYAWIPVVGPMVGGLLAGFLYSVIL